MVDQRIKRAEAVELRSAGAVTELDVDLAVLAADEAELLVAKVRTDQPVELAGLLPAAEVALQKVSAGEKGGRSTLIDMSQGPGGRKVTSSPAKPSVVRANSTVSRGVGALIATTADRS